MNVLILGGTRFTGRRLAELLLSRGASVTLLHRGNTGTGPEGVEEVRGDRSLPDGLAGLDGRSFDALVDFSAYDSAWVADALDRMAGRVRHYVFISSGTVYSRGELFPIPETAPALGNPYWGEYARQKVRAEELLRAAHQAGRTRTTVIRLPYVLGPANYGDRESFVLSRLEAGVPVLLPGGGTALNQHVHVDDVALGLLAVLERPDSSGGLAFNLAHQQAITNRGLVELLADAAGLRPLTLAVPSQTADPGFRVDLNDIVFPFPDEHFVLSTARAHDVLGFTAERSVTRMVDDFVRWWRERPDHTMRDYPSERRVRAAVVNRDHDRNETAR